MLLVEIFILLLFLPLVIGRIILYLQFKKEVKQLFAASLSNSHHCFYYSEIEGLPEPVQRYFKHVLKDGQPFISSARLTHYGNFKPNLEKGWVSINGEQYISVFKPGFVWKGNTNFFTARDMFLKDKGRLVVSLLSVIKIVDVKGDAYNQGELLRWLSESVWVPTNLLPNTRLHWEAIDINSARLIFEYNGLSIYLIVTFNSLGEIIEMESKRFMSEDKLETWIVRPSNYAERNNVIIPNTAEAIWKLESVEHPYAKFHLKALDYDINEMF